jgi:hypothetical protein
MRRKKKAKPHTTANFIPLVIGVSGHRDLRPEDLPRLEQVVRELLEKIRKRYKHTRLVILSPLAEGADRLVARVARDTNVSLIVPLPMAPALYGLDFKDDASRAEFNALLNYAECSFILPMLAGHTEKDMQPHSEARDKQYEQVGAYIVRHSQILLALWDGEDSPLIGGTAKIVKFQIEGVPEPYAPARTFFDEVESGPVYHLLTPRSKNPHPRGQPFTLKKLYPTRHAAEGKAKRAEAFDRIYKNIDGFNLNVAKGAEASRLEKQTTRSKHDLLPESEAQELPLLLQSLRDRYATADSLAIHFRKMMDKTLIELYALVFLAAVSFDIYAHLWPEEHWVLFAYLLTMGFAYKWVYRRAKKEEYENKYQDYRALAEGMRVQFFWCLANLHLSVAEHYLRKQRSELDWICSAIGAWSIPVDTASYGEAPLKSASMSRMQLILKHWVKAEADYHRGAARREKKKLEKYEPWIKRFLLFAVVLASILVLAVWVPHPWSHEWQGWLAEYSTVHHTLIVFLTLPPVAAALLHSYLEKAAFSEHFKQYTRTHAIFSNAEERLRELIREDKYSEAQQAIEALGKEALVENGDWVLMHRERPLEMVQ